MVHSGADHDQHSLERLLAPKSVAVVGASRDPSKLGGKVLANLERGFEGDIYAVNPRADAGTGPGPARWVDDLRELPDGIDLVILAVPQHAVELLLERGVSANDVGGIAVLAEPEGDAAARQRLTDLLMAFRRETGTRVLGPNTSGFRAYGEGIFATFAGDVDATARAGAAGAAGVSLVSQSGAMMAYLGGTLLRGRHVGLDYVIDTGNEIDVSASECLSFLARRGVRRVGLVLEGSKDWRQLRQQLQIARSADMDVVALQVGRSLAGQAISVSHTGAVGGSAGAFRTVFEAADGRVADDEVEFVNALTIDASSQSGRSDILLGSFSGGMNALIADMLADYGFLVPSLDTFSTAAAPIPAFAGLSNPIDFGPAALRDVTPIRNFLDAAAAASELAATMIFTGHVTNMADVGSEVFDAICKGAARLDHPVIVIGRAPEHLVREAPANLLVIGEPSNAVRSLAYATNATRLTGTAPQAHGGEPSDAAPVTALTWAEAERLLGGAGVPTPRTISVTSVEDAADAGRIVGFPVVVKADSPQLFHRARHGLVDVGVADEVALRESFTRLMAVCAELGLDDATILVQQLVPVTTQLFIGVSIADAFGPTVILSHGGTDVEDADRQRVQRQAPLTSDDCTEALRLLGIRPDAPLVDNIVAISRLAVSQTEATVFEVNPLCVSGEHPGGLAIDCLVLRSVPLPKEK